MKYEIYEKDGQKRCKIQVSEHEVVDRPATEEDLLACAEEAKQEQKPAPKAKGAK